MLRLFWRSLFAYKGLFALFLILLLGIPRFIIVLAANVTGNYNLVPVIFLLMILLPFIFLSRQGRKSIGLIRPKSYRWLVYSFMCGIAISTFVFFAGWLLYADTISDWFVYISKSYSVSKTGLHGNDRHVYFVIYAIIGMSFSPVGEEFFYRG